MKTSTPKSSTQRTIAALCGLAFISLGVYNTVMIQTGHIEDDGIRFVKRLDEMNGEVVVGRKLAHHGHWKKIESRPMMANKFYPKVNQNELPKFDNTVSNQKVVAQNEIKHVIQNDVSLEISELFNAKLFPNAPKKGDFSGSLSARDGRIESMEVTLPQHGSIQISGAEITGNVFEYDQDGSTLTGMVYEISPGAYMVTLTNGPFEGTRMKFESQQKEESIGNDGGDQFGNSPEAAIADYQSDFAPITNDDGSTMEVGQFGQPAQQEQQEMPQYEVAQTEENYQPEQDVQYVNPQDVNQQAEELHQGETYGFNFEGTENQNY